MLSDRSFAPKKEESRIISYLEAGIIMKLDATIAGILDHLHDGVYVVDNDRKIIYWNAAAERITGYTSQEVMGSVCYDDLLSHVDECGTSLCQGQCPLACTILDGQSRQQDVFLRHKNGHRVPISVRTSPLMDNNGVMIGAVESFHDLTDHREAMTEIERLRRLALLDPLTEIGNRRYGENQLHTMFKEADRFSWPFGVLFVDIDHFKNINDQYGHEVGDRMLVMVAKTMQNSLRSFDVVTRWGGEEFLCIIKNIGASRLLRIAEKLRHLIENSSIAYNGGHIGVTVSIGGATARVDDTIRTLVQRADDNMYNCKNQGRNCAMVAVRESVPERQIG